MTEPIDLEAIEARMLAYETHPDGWVEAEILNATREIRALIAEVERLREDVERYRASIAAWQREIDKNVTGIYASSPPPTPVERSAR